MNSTLSYRRPAWRAMQVGALALLAFAGCKPAGDTAAGNAAPGAASTASVAPAAPYEGETLRIGLYGSLTGDTATFGISSENGIKMAFKEINAKGGVLGKQLELISEDDASKTEQVPGVVQKLISENNVLAVLGEVASSRSLAAAPICQAAGVPMVSPSSTNPRVTEQGDYIFRTCFIDPFQGTVMAQFGRKNLKLKKAAIFTDNANDYSKGLTEFFSKEWKNLGGEIVATESYAAGDTAFQSQLTKIKSANPEVIYIPGYYTEVANICVQMKQLGMNIPRMGGDGWDSPQLFEIGKEAVQGAYFSNHYSPQSKDPRVEKFVKTYKAEFGSIPDGLAAAAYDAAYILTDAIKRAGVPDRVKIRDAMAATKAFPGVTGTISMDAKRNAVKPAVVLKIQGEESVYVSTIKP